MIKSRRLGWVGHIARMEEGWSVFKILTGTPTGKRPFRRPRHRCKDKIRMDIKEIGIHTRNWVYSTQDKGLLESPCECGIEPLELVS